jgi:hypothetical protein
MPLRRGFDEYLGESVSVDKWRGHSDLIANFPADLAAKKLQARGRGVAEK